MAIDALDSGYNMSQVSRHFQIPRSSLRDHYEGRTKSRKLGPQAVLTKVEEEQLVTYLEDMVRVSCPLNITELKAKVAEITQTRLTPFTNGILGKSWMKWFRNRHPYLVLRKPEGLDLNRARALCSQNVARFYDNLKDLYDQHYYEAYQIWNCDESGAQANKNGEGVVIAKKGTRAIHTIVPNERNWIFVLVVVNSIGHTMPNYYVFKRKRPREKYISFCEDGACLGMQENGYMDSENFSTSMIFFIRHHERRGSLGPSKRMLLILDGYKSHVTMEVLLKAKSHGVDMVSLPSHTSHEL